MVTKGIEERKIEQDKNRTYSKKVLPNKKEENKSKRDETI